MLKPLLLLSAAIIFAVASASMSAQVTQQSTPAQAAVPPAQTSAPPAQTAAPPAQAAAPVKGPVPPDAKNPVKPTTASLAQAKVIYNRDCALCHAANGSGQTEIAKSMNLAMPNWTDPKALAGKQDGELFDIIRVGMGNMPGEDSGRANNNAVWNLIYYIRGFAKGQSTAPESSAK